MAETKFIDARGLSCPMPVILTRRALAGMSSGAFEVRVDNATAQENVTRLAEKEGWKVELRRYPDGSVGLVLSR